MIIVRLQGGLGNQMFQYAFGKALSLKYNSNLFVDTSFFKNNVIDYNGFTARKYELNIFNANIKIASARQVSKIEKNVFYTKLLQRLGLPFNKCYHESKAAISQQLGMIAPPVLLIGYWQSSDFFKHYAQQIKEDFAFLPPTDLSTLGILKNIQAHNSVSVHIRRGDYVTNPVARDVLGTLDMEYYRKAINIINNKTDTPFYYFFSDDTAWVRANFSDVENYIIVENNGADYIDMYLMSKCRHSIIANSSFSWWGAWLNDNKSKTVIAPQLWNSNPMHHNRNLIPSDWLAV